MYAPAQFLSSPVQNINSPRTLKSKLFLKFKSYIYLHTLIDGDFNTPLSSMHRSPIDALKKEIMEFTDVINQIDQTHLQTISSRHERIYLLLVTNGIKYLGVTITKLVERSV